MIDAASLLEALWRRWFLYFQVGYIVACSHNSVISFRFLSLLWSLIQTNTSSKEGGGSRLAFKQKKDQISEKNEQLKKRWSLSSGALLHRRHSWGACRPQERNRSQVGSMFHTIIQERKECFVMEPEYQTTHLVETKFQKLRRYSLDLWSCISNFPQIQVISLRR